MSDTDPQAFDFEKSLGELETLVQQLEQGDLTLEQSLNCFEQGVKLTKACQKALDEAQLKVEILLKDQDQTSPFDDETADDA